jgi:hypothetical protein
VPKAAAPATEPATAVPPVAAAAPAPSARDPAPQRAPDGGSETRRRRLLVGSLLGAAVIVAAAVLMLVLRNGGGGSASPPADVVDVTVPGTRAWTDTGIDLAAGARVHIAASGTIQHNPDAASTVGPDGDVNPTATTYNAIVDGKLVAGRHASLIARVGTQDAFFVGSAADFTAATAGRLQLGVNDAGPENNSGHFDAEVTVNR